MDAPRAASVTELGFSVREIIQLALTGDVKNWPGGGVAMKAYLDHVQGAVSNVRSQISDLHCSEWGEVGLVTLVLRQRYTIDGRERRLTAPTSILFRLLEGRWKVAMVHSVPTDMTDNAGA
jgi:ketosteroid isomerase-like protein